MSATVFWPADLALAMTFRLMEIPAFGLSVLAAEKTVTSGKSPVRIVGVVGISGDMP